MPNGLELSGAPSTSQDSTSCAFSPAGGVRSSELLGATDWSSGELAGPCDHSDEGNAFIEGNGPCGDNGRIRGDFESILGDVLLPVVMLHLVQQVVRDSKAKNINPDVRVWDGTSKTMVVGEASYDLADDAQDPFILGGIDHLTLTGLSLDGFYDLKKVVDSPCSVGLIEARKDFVLPELVPRKIGWVSGDDEDVAEMSFIVGPAVVAGGAGGHSEALDLGLCFGFGIEAPREDMFPFKTGRWQAAIRASWRGH